MNEPITKFDGEYDFLSNFYITWVKFEGLFYNCSECAFQAAKTLNMNDRMRFSNMAPGKAKREGRKLDIRPDWDLVKDDIMLAIVRDKFNSNPEIAAKLLATGNRELIEGNYWNDDYWGVCNPAKGQNKLGKILIQVRAELRGMQ